MAKKQTMSKAAIKKKRQRLAAERRRRIELAWERQNTHAWRYVHPKWIKDDPDCAHWQHVIGKNNVPRFGTEWILDCTDFLSMAEAVSMQIETQNWECFKFRRGPRCTLVTGQILIYHSEMDIVTGLNNNPFPYLLEDGTEHRIPIVLTDKELEFLNYTFGPINRDTKHLFEVAVPDELVGE